MLRKPRWLLFAAIVVVLALVGLAGVSVATVRRSFPQTDGEISLPGLTSPVEVLRDTRGVAHLYADNAEDLFEAQGYVHAQDRFFEMDVRRHITAGRLSELFGPSQVETDTFIRTLGWRRVAEQELQLLSASTRRYLDAYADGVNAYLQSHKPADISLEYSLLGLQGLDYTPESWTAVDSLAWVKAMAWDLGANMDREVETSLMLARVGPDQTADLWPDYPLNDFDPIVTAGAVRGGSFDPDAAAGSRRVLPKGLAEADTAAYTEVLRTVSRRLASVPTLVADRTVDGATGSNSWVVSGDRTATGKPILANDPHLATSIPSTFTQIGLHCRTVSKTCPFEVTGYSFSGMPGVVIGRNASMAWGLTTSYVDAQDLYLEEVRGDTVRVGDAYQPLTVRTEEIKVAGEDTPRTITVRSSRHGPLLSDASNDLRQVGSAAAGEGNEAYAVSLAWTGLQPNRTMDALLRIDTATTFTQFRAAAKLLATPVAEPRLRRHRGHHRLSAAGCDPRARTRRRRHRVARMGHRLRLEGPGPVRGAALGGEPRGRVHRHREQPDHRQGLPATPGLDLLLRLAQPGDRGRTVGESATERRAESGAAGRRHRPVRRPSSSPDC